MVSYPLTTTFVQPGEPLDLIVRVLGRPGDRSVAHVAADNDCSPAHLYDLLGRARAALQPRRPGPVPGERERARLHARVQELEQRLAEAHTRIAALERWRDSAVVLDPQRLARLELVMASHNVTFRAMHDVLAVAFGAHAAPAVGTLHAHVHAFGRRARTLLDRARAQVCDTLPCVAADDVFLAGDAVKVVSEPRSNAILNVGRWRWHKGEDWALWLQEFGALRLFISDLGSDLVWAIDARGVPHVIDYWHEMDWWNDEVFRPLARQEHELGERLARDRRAMAKLHGGERSAARRAIKALERQRARIEREFYLACEAQERVRELYEPTRPGGLPWTDASVAVAVREVCATLRRIVSDVGWAAREHVERNAPRYGAHRVLIDAIEIELRPGSAWRREDVLRALGQERALRRRANDMTLAVGEQMRADRQARQLAASFARHCANAVQVRARWEDLVNWPRRSSSGTESFNNRLRVLQVVQRSVSDERMALHALAHNLTIREQGRRRGHSPYQILGVDFAATDKPWYDVLLEAA
ncbi:MAG: hypothetical protein U0324_47605 [Polyangiales bacterium]